MNLYIFRHGETYFTKHDIDYGDKVETAEILEEGKLAIIKLANYLKEIKTDANFTSPFKRCTQTSDIVADVTSKKFAKDERLHDWVPEKETVKEVIQRILNFSKELEAKNFQSVAICTHGYPINALIAYFTKGFIREIDLDNFPDCGVLVSIEEGKESYKDFN